MKTMGPVAGLTLGCLCTRPPCPPALVSALASQGGQSGSRGREAFPLSLSTCTPWGQLHIGKTSPVLNQSWLAGFLSNWSTFEIGSFPWMPFRIHWGSVSVPKTNLDSFRHCTGPGWLGGCPSVRETENLRSGPGMQVQPRLQHQAPIWRQATPSSWAPSSSV